MQFYYYWFRFWFHKKVKPRYGCKIPIDGLEHAYLYKLYASETGLVTDEKGTLSAQLVESHCGTLDGVVRADGSTESVHDGTSLYVKTIFSMGNSDGRILLSKSNGTEIEFWIRIYGTYAQIRLSEDGVITHDYNINHGQSILNDGIWHTLEVIFTPNNLVLMLDDVSHTVTVTESTIYSANDTILYVGWIGTSIPFIGKMAYMNVNNFSIFNFSEGNLNTLYNTGVGSDITLSNFDPTFWDSTQDVNHYNYLNGFDLWENGIAGEEVRVPIGDIVTQAGYTFSGSYQAKIGLNNCETKIKFQETLPESIVIKGAGIADVNGTYVDNGVTKNGKPVWENTTNSYVIWVYTDGSTWFCTSSTSDYAGYKVLESSNTNINMPAPTSQLAWLHSNVVVNPIPTVSIQEAVTGVPSSLTNPLSYSEFEADFGSNHEVYSFKIDKNHKTILIYNPALTPELDLKLTKCQARKTNLEIITDTVGEILVDNAGYVITTEV